MQKELTGKKFQKIKRIIAPLEDMQKFMERNIESDVTNIIHDVGVPAHIKRGISI